MYNGDLFPEKPKRSHFRDLEGQHIGRWTVVAYIPNARNPFWYCRCDCGRWRIVCCRNLRAGATLSCGCRSVEVTSARAATHRKTHTKAWRTWSGMKTRCTNQNEPAWKHYGGRGITVCERWISFENFLEDMGEPPTLLHTLDRIDNDGNYEPGNCRWATRVEQARNRRGAINVTLNGETKPLIEWAGNNLSLYKKMHRRITDGWEIERAIGRQPKSNEVNA